jgi:hypothetical protein
MVRANTPDAALGEAFQGDRAIDRVRDRPCLTGTRFTRRLQLLDLAADSAGAWALHRLPNYRQVNGYEIIAVQHDNEKTYFG